MNILITGGGGFIGSNLSNALAGAGHGVTVLENEYLGSGKNLVSGVKYVKGDACVQADLEACGEAFDVVIALAGTSSAPMFMEGNHNVPNGDSPLVWGYRNSIESFARTLEFARATGAKKVLYASTSSLYGNNPIPLYEDQHTVPPNHYAVTKCAYEHMARCYNQVAPELQIIGFRFMSVYGSFEEAKGRYANMISQFLWDIARGLSPVIYGDGDQFRDFTEVRDIIQAITLAMNHEADLGARVYNIGRGEGTSFNAIFEVIQTQLGSDVKPIYIPNPVKEGYVKGQHADISRIVNELGYVPRITLQQGISDLVANLDTSKIIETSSDGLR